MARSFRKSTPTEKLAAATAATPVVPAPQNMPTVEPGPVPEETAARAASLGSADATPPAQDVVEQGGDGDPRTREEFRVDD